MQLIADQSDADTSSSDEHSISQDNTYLQQFIDGDSQSAVFVAAHGHAVLLGVSRQLIGTAWTGATGFRYAGSIGPIQPSSEQLAQWRRIGSSLAHEFDLKGLFGVDAIVNDQGIWTIEVNPRYTSSIEVLEFGLELHAVADHVRACRDGQLNPRSPLPRGEFRGKAVIYASRDILTDDAMVTSARKANHAQRWPCIADIPLADQTIAAGHPVVTVFASSNRLSNVEPRLRRATLGWRAAWKL